MGKNREKITLTEEELEDFDFTGGSQWDLRDEVYNFVDEIRTDQYSDGPSWDIVVKRESDGKYFKWNCWDAGTHNGYMMESGDNYMEEVFPKTVSRTEYVDKEPKKQEEITITINYDDGAEEVLNAAKSILSDLGILYEVILDDGRMEIKYKK